MPAQAQPSFEQVEATKLKEISKGFFTSSNPDETAAKFRDELDVVRANHGDMLKVGQYAEQSNSSIGLLPNITFDQNGEMGADHGFEFRINAPMTEYLASPLKSIYADLSNNQDGSPATVVVMPAHGKDVNGDPDGYDGVTYDYSGIAAGADNLVLPVHVNQDGTPRTPVPTDSDYDVNAHQWVYNYGPHEWSAGN